MASCSSRLWWIWIVTVKANDIISPSPTRISQWFLFGVIVMGSLLIGSASLFVLTARRTPREHRLLIGGLFIAATLFVWLELAVGIFTDLGS